MVLSERRTEGRETLRQTGRQGERKRQDKASTSVPGARVCEGKAVKGGAMMGKDYMLAIIIVNYDGRNTLTLTFLEGGVTAVFRETFRDLPLGPCT